MTLSLITPIWKEAPFLRLLIPFTIGIFIQQNVQIDACLILTSLIAFSSGFLLLHFNTLYFKFKYNWVTGIFIHLILISAGYMLCAGADGMKKKNSVVNLYSPGDTLQLTLQEPLVEKERSYKSNARIDYLTRNGTLTNATGNVNVYFSKESGTEELRYGSSIILSKPLELIRSSGNPGAFDYKLYCRRQGIYYSIFLTEKDYKVIPGARESIVRKYLFEVRRNVLDILSKYISGAKESGLAKALLIGYKDELDKNLVQSYSNTGVVHIIAISGLHLGIIYWLLSLMVSPLQKKIKSRWISTILVLAGLWSFSFLAGAGPSVLRSAFMFSMIVLGNTLSKNANVFNNLAFSAFVLLCYNPYWLWDAGFQLSFAAVLSIVLFFKPIYNWLYFTNKIVDFAWKLIAVTLSAQLLTLPISIYHFHQLPVYFVLSNLLAVPLSSLILVGEILLCCLSIFPAIAFALGSILTWMIEVINTYVDNINQLPFAVWGQLQISFAQMLLLFCFIGGIATWVLHKQKNALWIGLSSLLIFSAARTISFFETREQLKLIVYNLQNATAIDFVNGRKFTCICDDKVFKDPYVQQLNLNPSRIMNRAAEEPNVNGLMKKKSIFRFGGKSILLIDKPTDVPHGGSQIEILILTKNTPIHLPALIREFSPKQIIADGSNRQNIVGKWRKEAEALAVSFHNVAQEGAYIQNLR
jgi:competence protein ComEC